MLQQAPGLEGSESQRPRDLLESWECSKVEEGFPMSPWGGRDYHLPLRLGKEVSDSRAFS